MAREHAAARVALIRERLAGDDVSPDAHSDGSVLLMGDESVDQYSGQQVFDGIITLLDVFDVAQPIEGVSMSKLWGPSLVRPSDHSYISPWVLNGEPCVAGSRISTSSIFSLSRDRSLGPDEITRLYPHLDRAAVVDAIALEARLRAA